jgi:hypothetical protein
LEIKESALISVSDDEHRSPGATVSAIGTAEGDEFLAPKATSPGPAVPRLNFYRYFIDEFHDGMTQRRYGVTSRRILRFLDLFWPASAWPIRLLLIQ